MKKCIVLALILLGLCVRSTAAPTLASVITNGLYEPYGVAVGWDNSIFITDVGAPSREVGGPEGRVMRYDRQKDALTNFVTGLVSPSGIVFVPGTTPNAGLYVADMGLHQVFQINKEGTVVTVWGQARKTGTDDAATSQSVTFAGPTALAADAAGNIYVADSLSGNIRRIDPAGPVTTIAKGFYTPSGVAVGQAGRIYVSDTRNHAIMVIETNSAGATTITKVAGSGQSYTSGNDNGIASQALFNMPRGLLWAGDMIGLLVCDSDNGVVRQVLNNSVSTYARFADDIIPYGLAVDELKNFLLTDLGGNTLRAIQINPVLPKIKKPVLGQVVNITNQWGVVITSIISLEGGHTFNNDVVVGVMSENGTETFYTKGPVADQVEDPARTNGVTPPFYINGQSAFPNSIVDPLQDGATVTVKAISLADGRAASDVVSASFKFVVSKPSVSNNDPGAFMIDDNATAGAQIWYTSDGTEPAQNPANGRLYRVGEVLNIVQGGNDIDFRAKAFKAGYQPSETFQQTFLIKNLKRGRIGVARDYKAGIGATVIVPVEVRLTNAFGLRSLQFRVEAAPDNAAQDPIQDQFRTLEVNSELDFIQYKTSPGAEADKPILFNSNPYTLTNSDGSIVRGLTVAYLGTNANLKIDESAVIALLAVPIPATAKEGDTFSIKVLNPSGTSDGLQTDAALKAMDPTKIVIANIPYVVGDSAKADGYNAGEFGALANGTTNMTALGNNDVNNAFYASMGVRTPYPFSDVFDAMDVFPEDSAVAVGGDGQIRYLDWQIVLNRSLGLDTNNWMRAWALGGRRQPSQTNMNSLYKPITPAQRAAVAASGKVWNRQALIGALPVDNVQPGATVRVPVCIVGQADPAVGGLQFRAVVEPMGAALPLETEVKFVKNSDLPDPIQIDASQATLGNNEVVAGWSLIQNRLPQALMKNHTLGYIVVTIPKSAQAGQQYRVSFANADGAPDLKTQYDFETLPSIIWVGTAAQTPPETLTDEWKKFFFGSLNNRWAAADADPDGDGIVNSVEFQRGANPVKLRLATALAKDSQTGMGKDLKLRWFAAAGKEYVVESSTDLTHWTAVGPAISGLGDLREFIANLTKEHNTFYRVRLK